MGVVKMKSKNSYTRIEELIDDLIEKFPENNVSRIPEIHKEEERNSYLASLRNRGIKNFIYAIHPNKIGGSTIEESLHKPARMIHIEEYLGKEKLLHGIYYAPSLYFFHPIKAFGVEDDIFSIIEKFFWNEIEIKDSGHINSIYYSIDFSIVNESNHKKITDILDFIESYLRIYSKNKKYENFCYNRRHNSS